MGPALRQLSEKVKEFGFKPKSFLEIGSRDGNDAIKVSRQHNIQANNVLIMEAHPELFLRMVSRPELREFNILNAAASDTDGEIYFNAADLDAESNPGRSSVLNRVGTEIIARRLKVPALTVRSALRLYPNVAPDICKIDVEGYALEVLHGFGVSLRSVTFCQIELETRAFWKGQALDGEVKHYMQYMGFELVDQISLGGGTQLDTLFRRL